MALGKRGTRVKNIIVPENLKEYNSHISNSNDNILSPLNANDFLDSINLTNIITKNKGNLINYKHFEKSDFLYDILGMNLYLESLNNNLSIDFDELSLLKQNSIITNILMQLDIGKYINNKFYFNPIKFITLTEEYTYVDDIKSIIRYEHKKTKSFTINQVCQTEPILINYVPYSIVDTNNMKILNQYIIRIYLNNSLDKDIEIKPTPYLYDVDLNNFKKVYDIKTFFSTSFSNYIKTRPTSIFCGGGFGSIMKRLIQRKANNTTSTFIQEELQNYVVAFNNQYKTNYSVVSTNFILENDKAIFKIVIDLSDALYDFDIKSQSNYSELF